MKKPLPVKIVEVLGWMYVALSVVWIIVQIVAQVFGIDQEGEVWPLVLCGSFPLLLSLGMVLSLRRGRRGWFLVPHTVILSLFLLCAIASLCASGCCCYGTGRASAGRPHCPALVPLCVPMVQ